MAMTVKAVGEDGEWKDPKTESEGVLVTMLFEKFTELYPDWKMSDRTDLAMQTLAVVKSWAVDQEVVPTPKHIK